MTNDVKCSYFNALLSQQRVKCSEEVTTLTVKSIQLKRDAVLLVSSLSQLELKVPCIIQHTIELPAHKTNKHIKINLHSYCLSNLILQYFISIAHCFTAMLVVYFLALFCSCAGLTLSSKPSPLSDRQVWSVCDNNGSCSCGPNVSHAVICRDGDSTIVIQNCYCMFYDEDANTSLLGTCLLSCDYQLNVDQPSINFYSIHRNVSLFNKDICANDTAWIKKNREGRFCGRCQETYGLAVYSYHYSSCIKCTDYGYKNWIKFFAVALLPLTVFVFVVIIFKINVPSSRLNGLIFMMQCITFPKLLRVNDTFTLHVQNELNNVIKFVKAFFVIFGVVNLDFLRDVYPYFCLHPKMNALHLMALEYCVALYPFLLIIVTYFLIKMYDQNYTLVVLAWKPFKWCLKSYNRRIDIGASLIQAFASLILLSSMKILSLTADIMTVSVAETPNREKHLYFYYDANLDYLRGQHLIFALLSLLLCFVFVILPFLLLVLYPFRCFHRFLNLLKLRCQALHIFGDVFQGSYKLEPHDLRIFSAFHLLIRLLISFIFMLFHTLFAYPATVLVLFPATLFFAFFRPYKNEFHNTLDVISIGLAAFLYVSYLSSVFTRSLDSYWRHTSYALSAGTMVLILMYAIVNLTFSRIRNLLRCIVSRIRLRVNGRAPLLTESVSLPRETSDGQIDAQDSPNERSSLIDPVLDI